MTMFVAMYGLQWGFFLIYSAWHIIDTPHISIVYINAIFVNLGGVFDYFAYTYMRMKYIQRGRTTIKKSVFTIPNAPMNPSSEW